MDILSKAQTRASNKYNAKAYDRISLQVKKGVKSVIQEHADAVGKSLNGYINEAIEEKMKRDKEKTSD